MIEKSFILPQFKCTFHGAEVLRDTALVVAGGRKPLKEWLLELSNTEKVICADRGAEYCLEAGIIPQSVYGDEDSAPHGLFSRLDALGTVVCRYAAEKDQTDLQLLLEGVGCRDLVVSGIWGGRFDHLYSAVFSLLNYKLKHQACIIMADEREVMMFLTAGEATEVIFTGSEPQAVSIMPLSYSTVADLSSVRWPLKNNILQLLHPYSVSNVLAGQEGSLRCSCAQGSFGLYMYFG